MLDAQNIGRRVDDRWLMRDVSLRLMPGDRVALTGISGSGKSVLLRTLAMLDAAQEGIIRWQNAPVTPALVPLYRSQVCYLHQRPALEPGSVEGNLVAPFRLSVHRGKRYDPSRIAAWLGELERSADFVQKSTDNLSGGESQIVALLRVLQLDPSLLLLDEPSSGLDDAAQRHLEQMVLEWIDGPNARRAFIWVSHDMAHAQRISTRLLTISDGRLREVPGDE